MKYLKTYMGVTSGTMAGRDDGHPEMKYCLYNNIDELAKDFRKQKDERYYALTEIHYTDIKEEILESLINQEELAKEKKRADIQTKIEELQKQLKDLS